MKHSYFTKKSILTTAIFTAIILGIILLTVIINKSWNLLFTAGDAIENAPIFNGKAFTVTAEYGEDKIELFDLDSNKFCDLQAVRGREYLITFSNRDNLPIQIELHMDGSKHKVITGFGETAGETVTELGVKSSDSVKIEAEEDGIIKLSYIITRQEETLFLPASLHAFNDFTAREQLRGKSMMLIGDINIENLTLKMPFTLDCRNASLNVAGDLIFADAGEGTMTVLNAVNSLTAGSIYIDAPLWDVFMLRLPEELEGKNASYYADVKTLNGESFDNSIIIITSAVQLDQLLDDSKYPVLKNGTTIEFSGRYSLEPPEDKDYFFINKPVSLIFGENIDLENTLIYLETREKSDISIEVQGDCPDVFLIIDSPFSDVTWKGNGAPEPEEFFLAMNAASYNGQAADSRFGGTGKEKLISISAEPVKNDSFKETVIWNISGNVATAYYNYSVSEKMLSNIKAEFKVSGGKAEFLPEYVNDNGTVDLNKNAICTVTDDNGDKRSYLVCSIRIQYDLPVINITTKDEQDIVSKEDYIDGNFSMTTENGDFSVSESSIQIRGRGNSTWNWPKKPYYIKFDKQISILGMSKAKKWLLLANYMDKSLMRNNVVFAMGKELDNLTYVPEAELADVFINGVYQGVYTICEKIEVKANRVEIDVSKQDDTGYLLEIGGKDDGETNSWSYFTSGAVRFVRIHSPDPDGISYSQYQYIKNYIAEADKAVTSLANFEDYIDLDSFVDWFILHEFTCNIDSSFRRSCFMTKEKGGKLKMGPPWDFDLALGNFTRDNLNYDTWVSLGSDDKDSYVKTNWMNYLITDSRFTSKLKERWAEVGNRLLDTGLNEIYGCRINLEFSQEENLKIWPFPGEFTNFLSKNTLNLKTFKEQVDYLETFLRNRKEWMDKAISQM